MACQVFSVTAELLQNIHEAVDDLDQARLLDIIHGGADVNLVTEELKESDVYHKLVNALWHRWGSVASAVRIVYLLCLHGANINFQDENGDTALLAYLRDEENISNDVLVAFLRCGADVTLKNKSGEDVLSLVLQSDDLPKHLRARVLEYMPGIWRAVDSDDAMTVRRLINQWCTVRVTKDDLSVLQVAFNRGTENIIRVISGIGPSMDLAFAVLAGDRTLVKTLLQSKSRFNINLKNMCEGGATPLFYAMCQNDRELVDMLLEQGARLNLTMEGTNGMELPLYLAALSRRPKINSDLLKAIIPQSPVPVDQLFYQGQNVIFYCVEHDVDEELFEAILRQCSACVLTQRIMDNLDVREFAEQLGKLQYLTIIDKVVLDWCSDEDSSDNRKILALHGYNLATLLETQTEVAYTATDILQLVPKYEECKARLCEAVEEQDLLTVKEILYNGEGWLEHMLEACLADSRMVGDGQPLLHKAVLRCHVEIVREIALCLFHKCKRKLDTIRDQYYRTALHYVYGMEDGKEMINILEDLGMSEYVMDKDGRSPQAFKDRRGQKEMKSLIQYHLTQDFSQPEPDPWSVKLPLPIVGFMTKCVHDHHEKKKTLTNTTAQYDKLEEGKSAQNETSQLYSTRQQYDRLEGSKPAQNQTSQLYDKLMGGKSAQNEHSQPYSSRLQYDRLERGKPAQNQTRQLDSTRQQYDRLVEGQYAQKQTSSLYSSKAKYDRLEENQSAQKQTSPLYSSGPKYDRLEGNQSAHSETNSLYSSTAQYDRLNGGKFTQSETSLVYTTGAQMTEQDLKYGNGSNMYKGTVHGGSNGLYRSVSSDSNGSYHEYMSGNINDGFRSEEVNGDRLGDSFDERGSSEYEKSSLSSDLDRHSLGAKLCRSRSDETLDSPSQSLREEHCLTLPKGDNSDSDSEVGELEEDYDGDYSDIETDEETSSYEQASYCIIL